MQNFLIILALLIPSAALAHVSQTSAQAHQLEHLLWALVIFPLAWLVLPWLKKIKQAKKQR